MDIATPNGAKAAFHEAQSAGVSLDLTRGRPHSDVLDLSNQMVDAYAAIQGTTIDGIDIRNYGHPRGLPSARRIGAEILGTTEESVLCNGDSSLHLMHLALLRGVHLGYGGQSPWRDLPDVAAIVPAPGYDRHFDMLSMLGIRMIPVRFTDDGPDVSHVADILKNNPSVRVFVSVPRHSNPTGQCYTPQVCTELAALFAGAAPDLRVIWDNAYALHDFVDTPPTPPMLEIAADAGCEDKILMFGSTSKLTLAGSGLAFMAGSPLSLADMTHMLVTTTTGGSKLSQAAHVEYCRRENGIAQIAKSRSAWLAARFRALEVEIAPLKEAGMATWHSPRGGYFLWLTPTQACAHRVHALAQKAGLALTPVSAPYPDRKPLRELGPIGLRIAPTAASDEELRVSASVLRASVAVAHFEAKDAS